MLTKILFIAGVIAAASAATVGVLDRDNEDNSNIVNCSTRPNGNYTHPNDCTRFIICSEGRTADMACANCDQGNKVECDGELYLRWNSTTQTCEWPLYTPCVVDGSGPTTAATSPPTTPDDGITTTVKPPTPGNCTTKPGDICDENDCEHCGYCKNKQSHYLRCVRTIPTNPALPVTGVVVLEDCPPGQWWNPDLKPTGASVGGACDEWSNLSPAVQAAYKQDPNCVPPLCEWGQDPRDKCTVNYWYFHPIDANPRENLKCNLPNLWDPSTETCRPRPIPGCP